MGLSIVDDEGAVVFRIPVPVLCHVLGGPTVSMGYQHVSQPRPGALQGTATCRLGSWTCIVQDTWQVGADGVTLRRSTQATQDAPGDSSLIAPAVQLETRVEWCAGGSEGSRVFAPGVLYSPDQVVPPGISMSEARLCYPVIGVYDEQQRLGATLHRVSLAEQEVAPERARGHAGFVHRTDIGSLGVSLGRDLVALTSRWPYSESPTSALLDAAGTPADAFFPLDRLGPSPAGHVVEYRLSPAYDDRYSDFVLETFRRVMDEHGATPVALPFSLQEAVDLRLEALEPAYTEWPDGGAGFLLNFDPEIGRRAQAKAFGASFAVHQMGNALDVLEYGFTGRQLNVAYMLAAHRGGKWLERGRRVCDFFVAELATSSGWCFTHYDLERLRPLYTCGDPDGTVLHYLAPSRLPGAYLRMMAEAGEDLLLNYRLHAEQGTVRPAWLDACVRLAEFLVTCQNPDGSWFRAYTPAGQPIRENEWFGSGDLSARSATSAAVPFLLAVADAVTDDGCRRRLREAAARAGAYVLEHQVARDDHRGGTLDNPNVVDKEAALLSMRALLRLHALTADRAHLDGAKRSADLAVTWNTVWDVPLDPATRLGAAGVRSTGWGAINSVWGAGVGDIYSLFFLEDLVSMTRLTEDDIYLRVAELVAHGTAQMLSHPDDTFGFFQSGLQPEGIAFLDQGVDEGLIVKGDVWGSLGWIYTAGTFGLDRYLHARRTTPGGPDDDQTR
jgi:hypothetical protein